MPERSYWPGLASRHLNIPPPLSAIERVTQAVAYLGFHKGGPPTHLPLPSLHLPSLSSLPPLPLEVGPLKSSYLASGGNNFNDFPENQLIKFRAL